MLRCRILAALRQRSRGRLRVQAAVGVRFWSSGPEHCLPSLCASPDRSLLSDGKYPSPDIKGFGRI